MQRLIDHLYMLFQRALPARRLGAAVFALTRIRTPWVRTLLIRTFVGVYPVDLTEVEHPEPEAWEHMNAFFTRPLRPGVRPIAPGPDVVVSPCDGTLEDLGEVRDGQLLQAKRHRYRLADLLVMNDAEARSFAGGATATIYLAPQDYHRVHMPIGARVREMIYVPGRRWAVNRRTTRAIPGLFAANERVILWCETATGRFAIVLVGALNVASISLAWCGEVAPGDRVTRTAYSASDERLAIAAGGLLGQFNLGSTVVIIADRGLVTWTDGLRSGDAVRMGEKIGKVSGSVAERS